MSIARYGDGEINICRGYRAKDQSYDINLAYRLREILLSETMCLVGIPRIADTSYMVPQKQKFWSQFQNVTQFYTFKHTYGSSFITRPDSVPEINNEAYYETVKALWEDKRVILIGSNVRPIDEAVSIFDNVKSLERWEQPSQDAWTQYASIMKEVQRQPQETLFVLSLGPAATVLAYDICQLGYQALDLGHLGMFYARMYKS